MKVKNVIDLVKDVKLYYEIIEEESGASFGEFWKSILEQSRFINYEVKKINFQYRNNKRFMIIYV